MSNRIFFRLSDDLNSDHALWTGAITTPKKLSLAMARRAVAKHLRMDRLPERTLVLTDAELAKGAWTEDEIRAETTKTAAAPSMKRKKHVSLADVPLNMDDVQAMMKKFGLA